MGAEEKGDGPTGVCVSSSAGATFVVVNGASPCVGGVCRSHPCLGAATATCLLRCSSNLVVSLVVCIVRILLCRRKSARSYGE